MTPILHSQIVTAWLPIRTTAFHKHQPHNEFVDQCIKEFTNSLSEILPLLTPEISDVEVNLCLPPQSCLSYLSKYTPNIDSNLYAIYSIKACVSFIGDTTTIESEENITSFLKSNAGIYLGNAISIALQLSELAYPGTILTTNGLLETDEIILETIERKYHLSCVSPYDANLLEWPQPTTISLNDVVKWYISIGVQKSTFATSRLQRTFASFTYVVGLGWGNEGEILFRAMQGLEALYCDGVGDLRRQLAQKSQIWLGEYGEKKNIVGNLYDLRSKFIHGSAKMPYWFNLNESWEEDENTMNIFSDGVDFSTRLLLTTLQKCIQQQVTEVNWTFTCDISTKIQNNNSQSKIV